MSLYWQFQVCNGHGVDEETDSEESDEPSEDYDDDIPDFKMVFVVNLVSNRQFGNAVDCKASVNQLFLSVESQHGFGKDRRSSWTCRSGIAKGAGRSNESPKQSQSHPCGAGSVAGFRVCWHL